ncbi:VOC family protein [Actinomadura syzygii]|uniref:VOC family protein n=1 Tax=Actinomadura syzygii TaxID=1427538 RepID=A0A5D0TTM1_9ACTN|nr:VOC family protein [Actinomadura syzygii]TYC08665.1 VOC family protein [Actinomadura syzygii]
MSRSFGVIRQLGYVVPDIASAITHWTERLEVGPFFYIERQPVADFTYRGAPSAPEFSVALAQAGHVQVELIQQHNDAPSAFREFTDAGGQGLQHIAYWTDAFDALTGRAAALGYAELQRGRSGSGGPDERFAYFTAGGHAGTVVEISEVAGRKAALFEAVAAAAAAWDGTGPVRDMTALVTR